MGLLTKIFGQNASKESGLEIFSRLTAVGVIREFTTTKPWEILLLGSMTAIAGSLTGTIVKAGTDYATGHPQTQEQTQRIMEAGEAAPGSIPGAAAGVVVFGYAAFLHGALKNAAHETRRQTSQKQTIRRP